MMVLLTTMTVLGIAIFIPGGEAKAAYSDFESGLDGWTFIDPSDFYWNSDEGNNGYVHFDDHPHPGGNQSGYGYAPVKFLGDWSSLDGNGFISFDYGIFDLGSGGVSGMLPYEINISGPYGSATWLGETHPVAEDTDWITVTAPLIESSWNVTSGYWYDLLVDVDELEIRIEYVQNHSADPNERDEAGFDNVLVAVPIPSAVWLLGSGLIGLVGLRKNLMNV